MHGTWKELIESPSVPMHIKGQLFAFRVELDGMLKNKCNRLAPATCTSFGSTDLASDIDVTISGANIMVQKTAFIEVVDTLRRLFLGSGFASICHVNDFFDYNLYLSDFGMLQRSNNPDDIRSYYVSCDYDMNSPTNQYQYAFGVGGDAAHAQCSELATNRRYLELLDDLSSELKSEHKTDNVVVDLISKISLYEDECYHASGTFIHVVVMIQRGKLTHLVDQIKPKDRERYISMFKASYVENMLFATHHPASWKKYILRANSAFYYLQKLKTHGTDLTHFKRFGSGNRVVTSDKSHAPTLHSDLTDYASHIDVKTEITTILNHLAQLHLSPQKYNQFVKNM
jgi:hypothetical protein